MERLMTKDPYFSDNPLTLSAREAPPSPSTPLQNPQEKKHQTVDEKEKEAKLDTFLDLNLSGDPHALDEPGLAPDLIQSSNSDWSFGGLITTLASKSESIIETYRRDLEEVGSGLKKETAMR